LSAASESLGRALADSHSGAGIHFPFCLEEKNEEHLREKYRNLPTKNAAGH